MMLGAAPRQTTSNLGHLRKPSIQALIHNLNRHYYSINIDYRKNELEQKMLLNLHKKKSARARGCAGAMEAAATVAVAATRRLVRGLCF